MDYGLSHAVSESDLIEGDHMYAWREALLYSHQGIYAGKCSEGVHWVIHFLGGKKNDEGSTGCPLKKVCSSREHYRPKGVSKTCLSCFLNGSTLRKYKYNVSGLEYRLFKRGGTCTNKKADDPTKVVARANQLLQNDDFGDYNLFAHNCESFALHCSTGDSNNAAIISNQVRHGIVAAATVLAFGVWYSIKSIYSYSTKVPEEESDEEEEHDGNVNSTGVVALAM